VEALWTSKALNLESFASVQEEYSLVVRDVEKDMLPMAQEYGLGILPYFPLASGLLTGKYKPGKPAPKGTRFASTPRFADRYRTDRNAGLVKTFNRIAKKHDMSLLELAFGWLLARPQVASVIAGATKPEQIAQNIAAAKRKLDPDVIAAVDKAYAAAAA
jgi:aryl-alcohol dehydrogenase-like predicted oxidoreductase